MFYRATLTAVPAPESIAADKGIRRAADKVCSGDEGLAGGHQYAVCRAWAVPTWPACCSSMSTTKPPAPPTAPES